MNFATTRDELESLFSQAGSIVDVVVPTDRTSGRPRGFAFVEFSDDDEALRAIEKFEGFELGGRNLRVNEATQERGPRLPSAPGVGARPFGDDRPAFRPKGKGSRRNLRARKRGF